MSVPEEAEQRREHRQRVLKGAVILATSHSAINCTIRNMTKEGAELRFAVETHMPSEFLLYVPLDGIAYRSTLRWRKADRCGVLFTGTEPKPDSYHG